MKICLKSFRPKWSFVKSIPGLVDDAHDGLAAVGHVSERGSSSSVEKRGTIQ
jgi:hypothetical protein